MDNQSITHTRWNCTYHIVFIPKFRRKIMYGETKRDLVETIKKLCEMKYDLHVLHIRRILYALRHRFLRELHKF